MSETDKSKAVWVEAVEDGVNIRTQPSTDATIVAQMQRGDRIIATGDAVDGGAYGPVCGQGGGNWWLPVDHFGTIRYVTWVCVRDVV
ncbi:SH3 domain-containing protein [Saccharopolyspora taberi]